MRETAHIRLLFPAPVAAQLEDLSRKIAGTVNSAWVLGGQTPPHITLFAFARDGRNIRLPRETCAVDLAGLCTLGDTAELCWIAARVKPSPELETLRMNLLSACGNPPLLREDFMPHVTLGHIAARDFPKTAKSLRNAPELRMENILCAADGVVYSEKTGYRPLD